nr:hypothetical protein [Pseudomonas sp. GM74]
MKDKKSSPAKKSAAAPALSKSSEKKDKKKDGDDSPTQVTKQFKRIGKKSWVQLRATIPHRVNCP